MADGSLNWQVLTSKRPSLTRDVPPGQEKWEWVANSSTLIFGERDAVLVDTFLTIDQSRTLLDWVIASGKNLTTIYVTHGHGDHFFGLAPLLDHFRGARALATPAVAAAMQDLLNSGAVDSYWRKLFPGQIADRLVAAEPLEGNGFQLEGAPLVPIDTGRTDTVHTTSLHVPSIGLIAAGDVVYNGIHPFLAETDAASRLEWLAALDRLEALMPKAVVAGHKIPSNDDDPRHIAETRRYILDFNALLQSTSTPRDFYDRMLALHPDRANPGSLWRAAKAFNDCPLHGRGRARDPARPP